jgi:predicted Zn-ribbon and HTH transcriptional regulator
MGADRKFVAGRGNDRMPSVFERHNQGDVENGGLLPARISRRAAASGLMHVHVCVRCGHARRREEITGPEMASGIFQCPSCDANGPLNVEIRSAYE